MTKSLVWIQYLAPGVGKRGPDGLGGTPPGAHGVWERGEPAVDYLHSTHHAGCDGPGPRVYAVGEDVRSQREVNRGAVQHRDVHGMLCAVFGFFPPTDPESQDAEGGHIQSRVQSGPAASIQSVAVYTLCTHTRADTATAQNLGSGCVGDQGLCTTSGAYVLEGRASASPSFDSCSLTLPQVVQDTSQLMGPLLVKALIDFAKAHTAAKAAGVEPANIGHGIGMVFGLLIVIVLASICQHQFFFRSMITGVLALTGALYRRAVHLTPAARLRLLNSAVLNHVSMDLGPSTLAGFALFLLIIPLQERVMAHQFALRHGSLKWTDERAGRVLEVVGRSSIHRVQNYSMSVGMQSLLSLACALVKDSRVVILDEATASVDLETDNKIQRMIQTQFKHRTLICIAHRLRTIISYNRILVGACTVLDAGKIAEFDTPLNLFNRNESLFRSLCDKSNITSGNIEKAIISDDVE
ncbi:hypothetical protein B0H13DRAFT_1914939 [Mycena leptocephala]|nr:hypothetical protein B0H13DRAFT_1914939 [Mycena leptocephala]